LTDTSLTETPYAPSRRTARSRFVRLSRVRTFEASAVAEGSSSDELLVREGLYRRVLALADALAAGIALVAVVVVWAGARPGAWILVAMGLMVLVNKVGRLYERDELVMRKSTLDEAPALLQITGLFALIAWLGHHRVLGGIDLRPQHVLDLWIASFLAILAGRSIARALIGRFTAPERCLVIGDRESIATVRRKLDESSVNARVVAGLPLDGRNRIEPEEFRQVAELEGVHRAIIAPGEVDTADTLDLIRTAKGAGVRVSVLPRLCEVVGSSVEFDDIEGLTMLGVRRFGLTRSSMLLKRSFDLIGASVMLLAVAPLMAIIALAVRLDSHGPVLFRQTRVGRDGHRFGIFKFRSMVVGADKQKSRLRHLNEADGLFKIAEDPRVTRVGRMLRRTSLDELPQLLNVWRGEMSLVGPRPLVVDEDAKVEGHDRARLHLTPGMTGHWQILGSARVPLHEMVGIDYLYVANWSLWTDVKILLRTVPYVLSRRGM
jgi:exopolysaccharide biosynthesis polyprenyl glycosylphosphotransferase